jgi:hypothetical protein
LETCDLSTRALHCVAAGREDKRISRGVETTWSWSAPAEAEATDSLAIRTCQRQCTAVRVCSKAEDGSHHSQEGGHNPSGHDIGPDWFLLVRRVGLGAPGVGLNLIVLLYVAGRIGYEIGGFVGAAAPVAAILAIEAFLLRATWPLRSADPS